MELFVSIAGNDQWSGTLPQANAEGTDGPFVTISRARDEIRRWKAAGTLPGAVEVKLRGGTYRLREPLLFGPEDSGPVTYMPYEGEEAVLDGGVTIGGWRREQVNGVAMWTAELPDVKAGRWYFRQLFVNGQRRSRPRLPKVGDYRMDGAEDVGDEDEVWRNLFKGSYAFRYQDGDIRPWRNLQDVDIVIDHFWVDERMPIDSVDEGTRTVRSKFRSVFILKDDTTGKYSRYFVENVREALSEPGQWYLDRAEGKLYYIPMPGETPETTEVVAPVATQLVRLCGRPEAGEYVTGLTFRGLAFRHTDWYQPAVDRAYDIEGMREAETHAVRFCTTPQSAVHVPGVIQMEGARDCTFNRCRIGHIGWYGVEVGWGCSGIAITNSDMDDLGAGGVKVMGSNAYESEWGRTSRIEVTDNHIHDGGHVFRNGTGVFIGHAFDNTVSHNHLHDFYYIGISCGWVWGYRENVTCGNIIEKNHIHDLGHGVMSDLGGIYTLGVQPGTVIRGNVIHDIVKRNYGGRGIYLDEGSANILVEGNICVRVSSHPFLVHYGRDNIIRNNIFGFGGEGQVNLVRGEGHTAFTFTGNIVLTDGRPAFTGEAGPVEEHHFESDGNVVWDVSGGEILCGNGHLAQDTNWYLKKSFTFEQWQAIGYDRQSVVADPLFADAGNMDFAMPEHSPARRLGFRPIDTSDVGPRPAQARGCYLADKLVLL